MPTRVSPCALSCASAASNSGDDGAALPRVAGLVVWAIVDEMKKTRSVRTASAACFIVLPVPFPKLCGRHDTVRRLDRSTGLKPVPQNKGHEAWCASCPAEI